MNLKWPFAVAVLLAAAGYGPAAGADPIYSQTPAVGAFAPSDRAVDADGNQYADDFTLGAPATARSVTWRGGPFRGTAVFPVSFDLVLYGSNAAGLPDTANVLSTTPVTFASASAVTHIEGNVYEFRATLAPTDLAAGTTYWFSPLADTTGTGNFYFCWATGFTTESAAIRDNVAGNGDYAANRNGPFYFVLDDAPVPEPARLALLAPAALTLLARRRGQ